MAEFIRDAAIRMPRSSHRSDPEIAKVSAPGDRESGRHFTHFDASGQAHMVDVGGKEITQRIARAGGRIAMAAPTLAMVRDGSATKGDVLGVARIAAIQAAKRTSDLIPLAHPLMLTRVHVEFGFEAGAISTE